MVGFARPLLSGKLGRLFCRLTDGVEVVRKTGEVRIVSVEEPDKERIQTALAFTYKEVTMRKGFLVGVFLLCFWASARAQIDNPRLETIVLGQRTWLSQSTASLRIIAKDHVNNAPVVGAEVQISLAGKPLFKGFTGELGTLNAQFRIPDLAEGTYPLVVEVKALGETDRVEQNQSIRAPAKVLLTTDKPLYQPGQVIYLRALALREPSLAPVANTPLVLEVEDSKGNKVFKRKVTTSSFGVASAQFQLADEINMGSYRVRAILGNTVSEKSVTVDRYRLPRFKVTVKTNQTYYLPGQTLEGEVQADYFFGKPVQGKVKVVLSRFEAGWNDFAKVEGNLDANGHFSFSVPLPQFFAGLPLTQGGALIKIATEVTDTADHTEQVTSTVPVSAQAVQITVIPEGGQIVPQVENIFYVITTTPDGNPVSAQLVVTSDAKPSPLQISTDATGLGEIHLVPNKPTVSLTVEASLPSGQRSKASFNFYGSGDVESLLLHLDKAIATVGQSLHITILSPTQTGNVYLDLVRDHQTVATFAGILENGRVDMDIPLNQDTAGTLEVHAYRFNRYGQMIRDTRLVFVNPAKDLNIAIQPEKEVYLPGSSAKVAFRVTDASGKGVLAALGLEVVDESVFALQEMQPGLEKVFFLLEKEILTPRYEIHGIDPGILVTPPPQPLPPVDESARQRSAKTLFAAASLATQPDLAVNTYEEKLQRLREAWLKRILIDADVLVSALEAFKQRYGRYPTSREGILALINAGFLAQTPKDQWGRSYIINVQWGETFGNGFTMRSRGPDGADGTADDLSVSWSPGFPVQGEGRYLIRPGDVDGDRQITVADVIALLRRVVGLQQGNPAQEQPPGGRPLPPLPPAGGGIGVGAPSDEAYDVNGDGKVNLADAILALRMAIGVLAPPEPRLSSPVGFPGRGGLGGPVFREGAPVPLAPPAPPPVAAPADQGGSKEGQGGAGTSGQPQDVRVRQFFPETLYVNPSILTDESGQASVEIPIADSITTWRMTALANSLSGQLGSTTAGLRVFQDFFVDVDFPLTLTQNDEVSVPVAVFNYLPVPQKVELSVVQEPWFDLLDTATKTLEIQPNDVRAVYFRIKVKGIGYQRLTVVARGSQMSDAVRREVEVRPDGQPIEVARSGRLKGIIEEALSLPEVAIPGTAKMVVKVYPGVFTQVIEGMDSIFQMPFGCFEQTSSTTYPNILALNYMKKTGKINPEVQLKAEGYINLGYQRLLSYEVKGGGFSWFGNPPANKVLTAYGLMEFSDMSKVYEVDPNVITRTQSWLISQQEADGTWKPDKEYLHEESWGRIQRNEILPTAYIAWALLESGYKGPDVARAIEYVAANQDKVDDPYTLGIIANALVSAGHPAQEAIFNRLLAMRVEEGDKVYWRSTIKTFTYSFGDVADIEATATIAYALVRSGKYSDITNKALNYLISKKDPRGTWQSTQATVLALKALVASLEVSAQKGEGTVRVLVNGKEAARWEITPEDVDVLRQVNVKDFLQTGDNQVKLEVTGTVEPMYQVSLSYWVPWSIKPLPDLERPLMEITVKYDRTQLEVNEILTAEATVQWKGPGIAKMVIVDLGIPPGFEVIAEDLAKLVEAGVVQKFNLTGRQIICYLEQVAPNSPVTIRYRLKAKYPIRAQSGASTAYVYYNPEVKASAQPVTLQVGKP